MPFILAVIVAITCNCDASITVKYNELDLFASFYAQRHGTRHRKPAVQEERFDKKGHSSSYKKLFLTASHWPGGYNELLRGATVPLGIYTERNLYNYYFVGQGCSDFNFW